VKFRDQKDAPIHTVRFLAIVPGKPNAKEVEFTYGDGPCGRHVDCLEVEFNESFLKITQGSTGHGNDDYEIKEFLYKMSDVRGRIVVTK
jgi:hypothetical protein